MQLSYWESDAMLDADFIVIGAGLIGLQTALALRRLQPRAQIVVLESGLLPAGASSRNAGFACFGSLTEILANIATMGEDAALALVQRRWRGLGRLRQLLDDVALGYEGFGGYELLSAGQLEAIGHIDDINSKLQSCFGRPVFSSASTALRASGFGPQVKALIENPFEAQIHSGRTMRALAKLAAREQIEIHGGAQVTNLEENGGVVRVHASCAGNGGGQGSLQFRAARVAVCTNGCAQKILPGSGVLPWRGQVLVTAPIPGLPWRGTYHFDRGYYYFRNIGERVLVGGGRNLAFADEQTDEPALNDAIQSALEQWLRETIVPGCNVQIEHRWAGIMGFVADAQPVVRMMSPRIALGFGCNGMGVALSAEIAAETAALLAAA